MLMKLWPKYNGKLRWVAPTVLEHICRIIWCVCLCLLIHYLPLWPVILGEDGIVCIHCPICHQHNSLATLAAPPSLIELDIGRQTSRERQRRRKTEGYHVMSKEQKALIQSNVNLTSSNIIKQFFHFLPIRAYNVSSQDSPLDHGRWLCCNSELMEL